MADYIDENILCQAYVHVEPDEITKELLEELKSQLNIFVKSRSDFFLYPDADIDITLTDGSIKVYATILGTIVALYSGLASSLSFQEKTTLVHEDVKRLSDNIATESIFLTRSKHNQVIRIEARTGVVGSVKKIVTQLESIKSRNGEVFADTLAKQICKTSDDIQILLDNLDSVKDENLIINGFKEQINKLPIKPTPPDKRINSREQLDSYSSSLKYIKEQLVITKKLAIDIDDVTLEEFNNLLAKHDISYQEKPANDKENEQTSTLEIILSPAMWAALAAIFIKLIKTASGRKIQITKPNGEILDISGLTKKELKPFLKKANKVSIYNK